nr:hypothetical protein [Tanacetum cinerariifolium]
MAKQQNPQQTPPQSPPHQHEQQEDQPESPRTSIPYDPAPQVDYSLDLINIKTTNEALKKDQPEGPPFTSHMLAYYITDELVGSKALKTTLQTRELGPEGTKPRAKSGYRKKIPEPRNDQGQEPSQPSVSIHVVTELHKEGSEVISGQTALLVTGEGRAKSQLSSVVSTSTTKPIYSLSTLVHFESALGHDALADVTAKADLEKYDPKDSLPPKQELRLRRLIKALMKMTMRSNRMTCQSCAFIITEMKELPSKVNEINRAVGDLKHYIEKLEIKVPSDLKALLDKLEEIQTSILALANKVAFLEDFRLEILAGLLALLGQVSSINA